MPSLRQKVQENAGVHVIGRIQQETRGNGCRRGAGEISLVHRDTLHYREKKNTTGKTKVQFVWTKT